MDERLDECMHAFYIIIVLHVRVMKTEMLNTVL